MAVRLTFSLSNCHVTIRMSQTAFLSLTTVSAASRRSMLIVGVIVGLILSRLLGRLALLLAITIGIAADAEPAGAPQHAATDALHDLDACAVTTG